VTVRVLHGSGTALGYLRVYPWCSLAPVVVEIDGARLVLVPGRRQLLGVVDVRDEGLLEILVRRSDLHCVEFSRFISCLRCEDVKLDEVRIGSKIPLNETIEGQGGVGLKGGREDREGQGSGPRGLILSRGFEGFVNCETGVANNPSQLQSDL
jgi:hypothetical protein